MAWEMSCLGITYVGVESVPSSLKFQFYLIVPVVGPVRGCKFYRYYRMFEVTF